MTQKELREKIKEARELFYLGDITGEQFDEAILSTFSEYMEGVIGEDELEEGINEEPHFLRNMLRKEQRQKLSQLKELEK